MSLMLVPSINKNVPYACHRAT